MIRIDTECKKKDGGFGFVTNYKVYLDEKCIFESEDLYTVKMFCAEIQVREKIILSCMPTYSAPIKTNEDILKSKIKELEFELSTKENEIKDLVHHLNLSYENIFELKAEINKTKYPGLAGLK